MNWTFTFIVLTICFYYGGTKSIEEKHEIVNHNNKIYEIISQNFLIFVCITLSLVLIFEKNIHRNIFGYISNFLPWKIVIEPKNDINQTENRIPIPIQQQLTNIPIQQQIPMQYQPNIHIPIQQPININPVQEFISNTVPVIMNPSFILRIMPFTSFLFSEFVKIFGLNDIKDSKLRSEKIDEITSNISNKSMKLLDDLQAANFLTDEFKITTANIFVSCLNIILPMICNEIANNKIHMFDQQQKNIPNTNQNQQSTIPNQNQQQTTNYKQRIPVTQNDNYRFPQLEENIRYYEQLSPTFENNE